MTTVLLRKRPIDLSLRWSKELRRHFLGCDEANELWEAWLEHNAPTDEQIYRKLLVDIYLDFLHVRHLGGEFYTSAAEADELVQCTGKTIDSSDEYAQLIKPLLDFELDNPGVSAAALGAATVRFIVDGSP